MHPALLLVHQALNAKRKNTPFVFQKKKKLCTRLFLFCHFPSSSPSVISPELPLLLPRAMPGSSASLLASSARWLFFFCELPLCPLCECFFFFCSSASFHYVLHRGKPNVPFLVSFCFHFYLCSAVCRYVVDPLKDLGHPQ